MIKIEENTIQATVKDILEQLQKAIDNNYGNLVIYDDDLCGHPSFYTNNITVQNQYAIVSVNSDEDLIKEDLVTINQLKEALEQLNSDLIVVAAITGKRNTYASFQVQPEPTDCIDSSILDDSNILDDHDYFIYTHMHEE